MNRIILFLLCTIFSINLVLGDVLPEDYAQDESLPYDEINQMIAERKGDLFPIDETTREYVDGTEDLGSATYQWNNLYLDDDLIVNATSFFVDGSAGNVGIGTASPSELLEVSPSANSSEGIKITNQSTGTAASAKINLASYSNALNIVSFGTNHSTYPDENWLYCGSGKSLVLGTNNTPAITIDSSGSVGIGTASPGQKLDVNGNITVRGDTTPKISFTGSDGTVNDMSIQYEQSNTLLAFRDNAGANRMVIEKSGNVGIGGVSTPAGQVEILASSGAQLVLSQDEGVDEAKFTVDADGNLSIEPSDDRVIFDADVVELDPLGAGTQSQITIRGDGSTSGSLTYYGSTNRSLVVNGDNTLQLYGAIGFNSEAISSVASNTISIETGHVLFNGMSTNQSLHTINFDSDAANYGILLISNADSSETITITHSTGNIRLAGGADAVLSQYDTLILMYQAQTSNWIELSRSDNS